MAHAAVDGYFALIEEQGGIVVREQPKFDLETYIQNYKGRTKCDRLVLISKSSVPLCLEALKAAFDEAKRGKDVGRYRSIWNQLRLLIPDEPEAQLDTAWIEATDAANVAETKRLEKELKGYRNNLVKESTRMGHEELGRHLESIGDLVGAADMYNRMRPDVSRPKHIIEMGKHLVRVSVQRNEWSVALSQLNKITGLQNTEEEKAVQPYLRAMIGLALLGQEKYSTAAAHFLDVDGAAPISDLTDGLLSANDVVVYGGLLALSTMDRRELRVRVLENAKFRPLLELEPHIRRAISQFINGRYAACLATLASYRADYMLDYFLQPHVSAIYAQIRSKCITHYLIPFSCVTLDNMNEAFAVPGQSLEDELVTMINKGLISVRIDSIHKLVRTAQENPRTKMQKDGLDGVVKFEQEALDRIRRMNLIAAELEVRLPRTGRPAKSDMSDAWLNSTPGAE